jgi:DNA-binding PadR family transcriptional regulator
LSIIEDEAQRRRAERLVRILEFCDSERTRNGIVAFAKRERIGAKRTIEGDLKYLLSKAWLSRAKRAQPGLPDKYTITESGRLEARTWREIQKGEFRGLVPLGPLKITYEFPKEGPGSLVGDTLRALQLKALSDPKRREELVTLIGSMLTLHAQRDKDDITTYEGKFLSDGRYQMAFMLSREDSIRLRKMVESGKLEPGREEAHMAELIGILGVRMLTDLFNQHEKTGFLPGSVVVSFIPFAMGKDGKFEHRIAVVPDLPGKIRETLEVQRSVESDK